MNELLIAGIVFLILLAIVVILTPYYWCQFSTMPSLHLCCLPFVIISILLALGVCLTIFGAEKENNRLRH